MPGANKKNKNSRSRCPGRLLKSKYVNYITVREFAPRHLKQNQKQTHSQRQILLGRVCCKNRCTYSFFL